MTALIKKEALANIEYVSIADGNTLEELEIIRPPAIALLTVRVGKTRLIDNAILA